MDPIKQDQADAAAILGADSLFAPVTILTEETGDIESEVLQQLATLNTKANKLGLVGVVLEPEEVPTNPDTPNPELRVRLTVQFIEEQTFNAGSDGTLVTVFAACRRVRQLLHRRSFGAGVWSWVGTTAAPQDTRSRRSRLVVFERVDHEESFTRLGAPIISPESGGAAPQEVTLTPPDGATAYYTLDGTFPAPGADGTTQYTVPFTIAAAATLRVVAYKTGCIPSSVATADFT